MSDKIVPFKTEKDGKRERVGGLISEALKSFLEASEKGEIAELCIFGFETDGEAFSVILSKTNARLLHSASVAIAAELTDMMRGIHVEDE